MHTARFEPWSFTDLLQRELDRRGVRRDGGNQDHNSVTDWTPAVDVVEEKTRYVLRADVPGVNPDAIDIAMDNGILSIAGERLAVAPAEDTGVQRIERPTGRFSRRFTLPDTIDADNITARCSNGILEVVAPKAPEVQPRRITIEAA